MEDLLPEIGINDSKLIQKAEVLLKEQLFAIMREKRRSDSV
jgi:hypothetical protein